jgi:hypothetical protein
MLNFGDLFFVDDKEYVWLFSDGVKIYAAIVLDAQKTKDVKAAESQANKRGTSHKAVLYCYVELYTENYSGCSANMIQTTQDMPIETTPIRPVGRKLEVKDLIEIREEILDAPELFNEALVEHVEAITLAVTPAESGQQH